MCRCNESRYEKEFFASDKDGFIVYTPMFPTEYKPLYFEGFVSNRWFHANVWNEMTVGSPAEAAEALLTAPMRYEDVPVLGDVIGIKKNGNVQFFLVTIRGCIPTKFS